MMLTMFEGLARLVVRRPLLVILGVLVVTGGLGFYAGQQVNEQGVAVENDLTGSARRHRGAVRPAAERGAGRHPDTGGRDVRSAAAVRTVVAIATRSRRRTSPQR
jgi:hypothetical protein